MTNFNVGDRVEILSDAIYPNGTSVLKPGRKSAIGKIGNITEIVDGDYIVSNLGEECGRYWWYKPNQLRKIENNEDKKETKMELKYDFIDEDHKRMHSALIAAAWSCENDTIPLHWKGNTWDWVYKKGEESIYFDNMHFEVLHRNINNKALNLYEKSFSEVA